MLSCHKVTRLFSESQERKLTLPEKMQMRLHTMMCDGCRNFGAQTQLLRRMARRFVGGTSKLPPGDNGDQSSHLKE